MHATTNKVYQMCACGNNFFIIDKKKISIYNKIDTTRAEIYIANNIIPRHRYFVCNFIVAQRLVNFAIYNLRLSQLNTFFFSSCIKIAFNYILCLAL